jgi:hypothetical protein
METAVLKNTCKKEARPEQSLIGWIITLYGGDCGSKGHRFKSCRSHQQTIVIARKQYFAGEANQNEETHHCEKAALRLPKQTRTKKYVIARKQYFAGEANPISIPISNSLSTTPLSVFTGNVICPIIIFALGMRPYSSDG